MAQHKLPSVVICPHNSTIIRYVERLDAILKQKLRGVEALKAKLERFKDHLAQEEKITATVRPANRR